MDVRKVHVRAVAEVVAAAEVDVAERLEVRDRAGSHPGLLRRGEAEEELGRVRDQVGARDTAPRAPSASAASWLPSKPPPAKPRRIVVNVNSFVVAEPLRSRRRCARAASRRSRIATSFDSSTVSAGSLWNRTRVEQHRLSRPAVVRQSACRCGRDEPPEVRQAPRDRDAEAGRRRRVVAARGRRAPARASLCASRRSAGPTATRAVTISWWSGGTSTSMPSERTTRIPSRRCCSGRNAPAGTAARDGVLPRELVDELVDPGRPERAGGRAGERLPAVSASSGGRGLDGLISTSVAQLVLQVAQRRGCR